MAHLFRNLLLVAAVAAAGAWIYVFAGTASQLRTLFDGAGEATGVTPTAGGEARIAPRAVPEQPAHLSSDTTTPAADEARLTNEPLPPTPGEITAAQIMRLLADELATETDPAATDELLRAFGESLETQE